VRRLYNHLTPLAAIPGARANPMLPLRHCIDLERIRLLDRAGHNLVIDQQLHAFDGGIAPMLPLYLYANAPWFSGPLETDLRRTGTARDLGEQVKEGAFPVGGDV